jgi:hypothetical protein
MCLRSPSGYDRKCKKSKLSRTIPNLLGYLSDVGVQTLPLHDPTYSAPRALLRVVDTRSCGLGTPAGGLMPWSNGEA